MEMDANEKEIRLKREEQNLAMKKNELESHRKITKGKNKDLKSQYIRPYWKTCASDW